MPVKDQVVRAWIEQTAGAITDLAQSLDEADRAGLLLDLVRAVDRGATRAALEALPERFGASRREHRSLLMVFNAAVEHATTLCVMGSGGGTTLFVRPPA